MMLPFIGLTGTFPEKEKIKSFIQHSALGSGSNPKVKTHPEIIWNLVWLCMVVEKNLFRKNSMGGPSSKFKNLAKKWKILKFFLMCIWTQVWLSIISKKNFKFFHFTTKFFSWSANVQSDEKNFCCKIFSLLKK